MKNICLFNGKSSRDIVLTTNGDYVINRLISNDKIVEKLDGEFSYEATILIDTKEPRALYELLVKGSILKVPDEHGDEIFRIASVQKTKRYIQIYARQITIEETLALWLDDVRPENQTGQGALQWLLNNARGIKDIFVSSDIKTVSTAYYVDRNMYEAIVDGENAFLERWGGEIKRKQYNLYINEKVGRDNGVQIASRKNLKGFDIRESETVITGIKAKGFDGIGSEIIYSPLRNNYPRTYIKEFKYEDVRLKTEDYPEGFNTLAEAQAELNRRAKLEFSKNNVDKIQAEYNLDFIELSKTEEYKDVQATEKVEIGDTVNVKIDTFDLNINVRCIEREYSPTKRRRLSTKLSTKDIKIKPPQISDIIAELEKNQQEGFQGLSGYVNSVINSGFKDSYYISRPNEALWLDNPDINLAKNVVRINRNGIGFSQTGYYGQYEYGFTIDGKINASLIAVGVLSTIVIQNEDGSFVIDLSSKGGATFKNDGEVAIKIENNSIKFYDWEGKNRTTPVGQIYSTRTAGDENKPGVAIGNETNATFDIVYRHGNGFMSYVTFDKDKVIPTKNEAPVTWYEVVDFLQGAFFGDCTISGTSKGGLGIFQNDIKVWYDPTANKTVFYGDIQVEGNKNCIQKTKNFGKIPFYANEDINSLLTKTSIDEWHETTETLSGEFKCIIKIPDYLKECINTDMDYIVWIDKKGFGDYYCNTYPGYFVVISDRPIKFRYKLEGRRKGFENENEKKLMV